MSDRGLTPEQAFEFDRLQSKPVTYFQPKPKPLSPSARKAISRAQKLRHAKEKESK